MKKILIIEDDITLCNGIAIALKNSEYKIQQGYCIADARKYAIKELNLIILDIMLPDGSGLDLLKEIRKTSEIPIILLTANDMELDIVTGLELGADDYVTKPFSLAVLRARVNTQLRKGQVQSQDKVKIGPFQFDFNRMVFQKNDEKFELSKTEQKLLHLLVINKGQTIPRAELVDRIWTDGAEYVDENALSVTIKRLRDKLENNASKPVYIKNVYGIGYTWAVSEDE